MNMTLKVLSCSPRVFEIRNFLSEVEVDHILEIATGMKLYTSTTRAGTAGERRTDESTRTSKNTWVPRERSAIIDAIHRRAADLLRVHEAIMRQRTPVDDGLVPPGIPHRRSATEHLQLVHYDIGQQYTPHHDFATPDLTEGQPMRFATILFYLNNVTEGGETSFPRWLNSETRDELKVSPEVGKVSTS
jgi:prolyl 4-hydroxylase